MHKIHFEPASFFNHADSLNHMPCWVTHTKQWANIIEKSFPHIKAYIIADKLTIDKTTSFLPIYKVKRPLKKDSWLSIPYANISDPIMRNDALTGPLLQSVINHPHTRGQEIEIRTMQTPLEQVSGFALDHGYANHQIRLDGDEKEIFSRFHKKSVQVLIRKSIERGTTLRIGNSLKDVTLFYSLYVSMRKDLGLPPQPFRFFKNMWEALHPINHVDLLMAENNGNITGALWVLKNSWLYSFEYLGRANRKDQTYSTHFLYWNGILQALNENVKIVSFARTSAMNEGLDRFKLNWGTVAVPYTDLWHPNNQGGARESSALYKFMKKCSPSLPHCVFRVLGEIIYRFI